MMTKVFVDSKELKALREELKTLRDFYSEFKGKAAIKREELIALWNLYGSLEKELHDEESMMEELKEKIKGLHRTSYRIGKLDANLPPEETAKRATLEQEEDAAVVETLTAYRAFIKLRAEAIKTLREKNESIKAKLERVSAP